MPATPTPIKGRVTIEYSVDLKTGECNISSKAQPENDARNTIQILLGAIQGLMAKMIQEDSMIVGRRGNDGGKANDGDKKKDTK